MGSKSKMLLSDEHLGVVHANCNNRNKPDIERLLKQKQYYISHQSFIFLKENYSVKYDPKLMRILEHFPLSVNLKF
jgi:hypothetical protein